MAEHTIKDDTFQSANTLHIERGFIGKETLYVNVGGKGGWFSQEKVAAALTQEMGWTVVTEPLPEISEPDEDGDYMVPEDDEHALGGYYVGDAQYHTAASLRKTALFLLAVAAKKEEAEAIAAEAIAAAKNAAKEEQVSRFADTLSRVYGGVLRGGLLPYEHVARTLVEAGARIETDNDTGD